TNIAHFHLHPHPHHPDLPPFPPDALPISRPCPLDCSKSGPGRRDMSSFFSAPFSTSVTFSPRTPSSSTPYPPISGVPLNSLSARSEEHTSELQSRENLVCRLLLEKKTKRA